MEKLEIQADRYNFKEDIDYKVRFPNGLSERVIKNLSDIKGEPNWMKEFRLNAYKFFSRRPMPNWIDGLDKLNLNDISYFALASDKKSTNWEDVPKKIKDTYDKLGIPEAEKRALGGVEAMFDSTVVYNNVREELKKEGIIFCDTDSAVKDYPELVKKYFGKVVSPNDNKFAALNSALWSGGSFIYVPKGVKVKLPLQAYFRINAANMGQFERTLIIADEGADVTYVEGCSATTYSKESLHAAVVEIIAMKGAHVKYITIQNWSSDVYNLVTKRAFAYENAYVEWIDANIGAKLTAKYPSVYMLEPGAKANILSIAFADKGQHQDAGAKAIHLAPATSSVIRSKSICLNGGRTTYRGLVKIPRGSKDSNTSVTCDALIFDDDSRTDTYPYMEISEESADVSHEASVGKIGEDQRLYMESRGIPENEGINMVILGFVGEFIKELPMEFALEFNRLIKINMENAVG
ncbi:Fe-S cluster assembly protein SufB [Candidatus Parvarchaeota archaeon]|uniref:Fe-S cluster assembly protein SufB n=1 Tax=Candidatus Acidifodinimicrobium mancum TaxID=2898728 RepID=A0A8T3UYJ3_9ARCH|nr:Fe-S cluster assembly protein SufB [Candidatus Acidifodinimicrobium mancum]MBE5728830.1 Fe-S cluster assembly protein SufB [Candidatus Acidifodinimicrobium mancum]MBE5730046.1 Fe-S cluster assembly protein SufB [Candidatus Acidifodinimicrobium mancum]